MHTAPLLYAPASQSSIFSARQLPPKCEPPELLAQAEEWQELLDAGRVANRAALAKRVGVSAWRAGSVLALLKLHPTIIEAIRGLPPGTPERLVTERKLRPLTRLSRAAQLRQASSLIRELRKQSRLAAS